MRFLSALIAAALGLFIVFKLWCKGTVNDLADMQYQVRVVASNVKDDNEHRAQAAAALVEQAKTAEGLDPALVPAAQKALAGLSGVDISDDVLADPKAFAAYQAAQDNVSAALDKLIAALEKAPETKPNPDLRQARIEAKDMEERVATDKSVYNQQAAQFNAALSRFPGPLVVKPGQYRPEPLFAAKS